MTEQSNFPERVIRTPLGEMSQGVFLEQSSWEEVEKSFFRTIWQELPQASLQDIVKTKKKILEAGLSLEDGARRFIAQYKKAQINRPVAPKMMASLGKTGAYRQVSRTRRRAKELFVAQGEREVSFRVQCRSCSQSFKIMVERAGMTIPCAKCQRNIEIPNPAIYFRRYEQKKEGPYSIKEIVAKIREGSIVLGMEFSQDSVKWTKIDKAEPWLMLLAKYTQDNEIRNEVIQSITNENFFTGLIIREKNDRLKSMALSKVQSSKFLMEIMNNVEHDEWFEAALHKLPSQKTIAEFIRETSHERRMEKAAQVLTDQNIIKELAKDLDEKVRKSVIAKITDQSLICEMVVKDPQPDVRLRAAKYLKNPEYILEIANDALDVKIFNVIVREIEDQQILPKILHHVVETGRRKIVISQIIDSDILAKVLREEIDDDVRKTIVSRITDLEVLVNTALNDITKEVQMAAVAQIESRPALEQIVKEGRNNDIWQIAVEQLPLTSLSSMVMDDIENDLKRHIVQKIDDEKLLINVFEKTTDPDVCWIILRKISDQQILTKVAIEHEDFLFCSLAENRVCNPEFVAQIAMKSTKQNIREKTTKKLYSMKNWIEDKALLDKIASKPEQKDVDSFSLWQAIEKMSEKDPNILMKYLSPVVLQYFATYSRKRYESNLVWNSLKEIYQKNPEQLLDYFSKMAASQLISDSLTIS